MKIVNNKGNLNSWFSLFIGLVGCALMFGSLFYWMHLNFYIVILGLFVGMVLCGFSAYAIQSATLDLRAFTNDPLGWRKAKSTYKKEAEFEETTDKP
jgi:hypothetical protein